MANMLESYPELSPIVGSTAHRNLVATIHELEAESVAQQSGKADGRGKTALIQVLRRNLRELHVRPLIAAAQLCCNIAPTLTVIARMSERRMLRMVAPTAGGLAEVARAHEDLLIDAGLPPTFIEELEAAAIALSDALIDRSKARVQRAGATRGLAGSASRASQVVCIVDAQVRALINKYGSEVNPSLLGAWESSTHIRAKPGVPQHSTKNDNVVAPDALAVNETETIGVTPLRARWWPLRENRSRAS